MKVNNIFKSFSGEVSNYPIGTFAVFVRLYGCNMLCSYCDAIQSVRGNNYTEMSPDEVLFEIKKAKTRLVVFTGGEPLLQDLSYVITRLQDKDIIIETNGSISPEYYLKFDNVSIVMDYKFEKKSKWLVNGGWKKLREQDLIKAVVKNTSELNNFYRFVKDKPIKAKKFVGSVHKEGYFWLIDVMNETYRKWIDGISMQCHKLLLDANGIKDYPENL